MKSITVYRYFGLETTPEGRVVLLLKLRGLAGKKKAEPGNIQEAQNKVAGANGFKIGKKVTGCHHLLMFT